jgi:hypothetical protein
MFPSLWTALLNRHGLYEVRDDQGNLVAGYYESALIAWQVARNHNEQLMELQFSLAEADVPVIAH